MPIRPKNKRRPWEPKPTEYNKMQGQGRRNVTGFYQSPAWRKLRNTFMRGISYHLLPEGEAHYNQFCIDCQQRGIVKPCRICDHIHPVNQANPFDTKGGQFGEPLLWENLQPLCEKCHNQKSAKERWK